MAGMDETGGITAPHGAKGRRVADHLRCVIQTGRFAPGQRLVEGDLTRELAVGRGLLREAFRDLAAEGLVELVPNRGAMVRRLTRAEALELFEIRAELEALAARRAAERMGDPCLRRAFAREIAPIWDDSARLGVDAYILENEHFHGAILTASGNARLSELHSRLQLALILYQVRSALGADVLASSVIEHRAIAQAILERDAAAADKLIRSHLARAEAMIRNVPRELFRENLELRA
jgi:DNA-binding GntR family transcriptional regulator